MQTKVGSRFVQTIWKPWKAGDASGTDAETSVCEIQAEQRISAIRAVPQTG